MDKQLLVADIPKRREHIYITKKESKLDKYLYVQRSIKRAGRRVHMTATGKICQDFSLVDSKDFEEDNCFNILLVTNKYVTLDHPLPGPDDC